MPGRTTPLVNDQFYHVFNRGSDKRDLYLRPQDYKRFIKTLYYYQFSEPRIRYSLFNQTEIDFQKQLSDKKLVDIVCYCLMPNHFHLLLRQMQEGGISKFLGLISNSYTKYFNVKYRRIGPLLQGAFKSVIIENDDQLIHVSRYIHLNPVVSHLSPTLNDYSWSSYYEYKFGSMFCKTNEILSFFKTKESYLKFLNNQIDYGQTLEYIKHHNLDND